jgi:hypothetical protein
MTLALPGAINLFSKIPHVLTNKTKTRSVLYKGVHQLMDDFRWLLHDMSSQPTRNAELVTLYYSVEGHHNVSGKGAGGVWFPITYPTPKEGASHQPLMWCLYWPLHICDLLVADTNPRGTITHSDMVLTGK